MKYKLAIVFIFPTFWVFSETSLVLKISENVISFARDRSGNCSFQNSKIWIFLCYGFMYIVRDLAAMTKSLFLASWLVSQIYFPHWKTNQKAEKSGFVIALKSCIFNRIWEKKKLEKLICCFYFLILTSDFTNNETSRSDCPKLIVIFFCRCLCQQLFQTAAIKYYHDLQIMYFSLGFSHILSKCMSHTISLVLRAFTAWHLF